MALRVLSWNLFHGRAVPAAGKPLLEEFAVALSAWEWDVALLQEVPPWWPAELGRAAGAEHASALTSRNFLLPARRFVADRWPDLIKSNGGGANAILSRAGLSGHTVKELTRRPERRVAHGIRVDDGTWVVNLHASTPPEERGLRDTRLALATALEWSGDGPLVFGGDLNLRNPTLPGLVHVAGHHVDHLFARRLVANGMPLRPNRGTLSDHEPLLVQLAAGGGSRADPS